MKRFICVLLSLTAAFLFTGCSMFLKTSDPILPHLPAAPEAVPVRSVKEREAKPLTATDERLSVQLEEMSQLVVMGYRPDFTGAAPQVKAVYDEALKVLDTVLLNDYGDFEKVHAIHDYLAYYVRYDAKLYKDYLADSSSIDGEHASFHLTGAILNKSAVCDGISKAFTFLCALEGIPVIRLTGEYLAGTDYIPHAWNKVRVGDIWYNVDVTMDNALIETGSETLGILHHGYFLLSDAAFSETLCGRHRVSGNDPADYLAPADYPFHENCDGLSISGKQYSMRVTDQKQLNDIFAYIKKQRGKIGKLELQLKFENYSDDDLASASAYSHELELAYALTPDKAYAFAPMSGKYPYLRYPNGVFLLLIYK